MTSIEPRPTATASAAAVNLDVRPIVLDNIVFSSESSMHAPGSRGAVHGGACVRRARVSAPSVDAGDPPARGLPPTYHALAFESATRRHRSGRDHIDPVR